MSLMNFIEMGFSIADADFPEYKGKFDSTIGSEMGFIIGSQYEHIFGGEVKLFCDPVDMIFGGAAANPLAALLLGVGGNVDFCYGSNTSAHYVGPKIEIRRAPVAVKNSEYDFCTPRTAAAAGAEPGPKDPVDWSTAMAVGGLSVLICATALAFDLALHCSYPKFGSEKPGDEEEAKEYGNVPKVLRICSISIVSRLMALLRMVEIMATRANQAEQDVEAAEAHVEEAAAAPEVAAPPVAIAEAQVEAAAEQLEDAAEEAAEAVADGAAAAA